MRLSCRKRILACYGKLGRNGLAVNGRFMSTLKASTIDLISFLTSVISYNGYMSIVYFFDFLFA